MAIASIADAKSQYETNLGYRSSASASMALLFAEACDYMVTWRATASSEAGRSMQFDSAQVAKLGQLARSYASSRSGSGGYRHFDVNSGDYRGRW
jgi:hypothetical protein